jgi:hypothetical protein
MILENSVAAANAMAMEDRPTPGMPGREEVENIKEH